MRPDVVLPLLKCLGDVHFIQLFGSCFGKQRYSTFMESAKLAAFNEKLRFVDGCDYNAVPADDAFTVLDLLCILTKNDARLLLDDPAFEYNRISRARVDASANLSAEEVAEVAKLSEEIGKTKDPKVLGELAAKLAALTEKKQEALKFVEDKSANPNGYAIANLTYNEDRPNISVLVRKTGTVTLSGRLAEGEFPKIPRTFPTFIFRNYAIVKDGLVNVDKLPCMITPETLKELREAGMPNQPCLAQDGDMLAVVFDLSKLPIINRNMVKACSAKRLFEKEYALLKARAAQKVFNAVKKEKFPRTSEGFEVLYGADAAAWLKEQGFTDYSGFGPKQVQAEATDVYMAKELKVSLKGLSSLPSMNEFKKQAAKGKLNAGAQLMAPCVKALDTFLESDVYKSAKNQDALFEAWLDGEVEAATKEVRRLIADLAQIKFSVVVGQVWPVEFATIEENTLEIEVDGQKILGKIEMREVEQKI